MIYLTHQDKHGITLSIEPSDSLLAFLEAVDS